MSDVSECGAIDVFVVGDGQHEGVVLRLPGRRGAVWGIVDCCCGNPRRESTNHTLRLLREHQVRALQFVCITHPHYDHYCGLLHVLREEQITIAEVVSYPGSAPEVLEELCFRREMHYRKRLRRLRGTAGRDGVERRVGELVLIRRELVDGAQRGRFRWRLGTPGLVVHSDEVEAEGAPARVEVVVLGPTAEAVAAYEEALRGYISGGAVFMETVDNAPNLLSLCVVVKIGDRAVLLGGDTVDVGWESMLRLGRPLGPVECVKVSHHGSMGAQGVEADLWRGCFCGDECRHVIGVVARFGGLPTGEGLAYLGEFCKPLIVVGSRWGGGEIADGKLSADGEEITLSGGLALFGSEMGMSGGQMTKMDGWCCVRIGGDGAPSYELAGGATALVKDAGGVAVAARSG